MPHRFPAAATGQLQHIRTAVAGGLVLAVLLGAALGWWQWAENFFYDLRQLLQVEVSTPETLTGNIAVVAIDDEAIRTHGRWPWPRQKLASLIDRLAILGPRVIVLDLLLSEPTTGDNELAVSFTRAGTVLLPYHISGLFADSISDSQNVRYPALTPIETLRTHCTTAHGDLYVDPDGRVRSIPALAPPIDQDLGRYAVSVTAVAAFLGLPETRIEVRSERLQLGEIAIPLDHFRLRPNFASSFTASAEHYPSISAGEVLTGQIPKWTIEDKIVFIGVTGTGLGDRYLSPVPGSNPMPGVVFHAVAADSILSGTAIQVISWHWLLLILPMLAVIQVTGTRGGFLYRLMGITAVGIMVILMTAAFYSVNKNIWIPVAAPVLFLLSNLAGQVIVGYRHEQNMRRRTWAALSRYFAPEFATDIINKHSDPFRSRSVQGCVLFVDLSGFTSKSETLDPEEVICLLNRHFAVMESAIFRYGGAVDKFLGDGVMAIFGLVGSSYQEAVEAALAAAWEIVSSLDDRQKGSPDLWLTASAGVAAGPIVAGDVGTKRRVDYTAVGNVVNTAARLEEAAPPGCIFATEEVAKVSRRFRLCPVGSKSLPGKAQPQFVYRVTGPKE